MRLSKDKTKDLKNNRKWNLFNRNFNTSINCWIRAKLNQESTKLQSNTLLWKHIFRLYLSHRPGRNCLTVNLLPNSHKTCKNTEKCSNLKNSKWGKSFRLNYLDLPSIKTMMITQTRSSSKTKILQLLLMTFSS